MGRGEEGVLLESFGSMELFLYSSPLGGSMLGLCFGGLAALVPHAAGHCCWAERLSSVLRTCTLDKLTQHVWFHESD